MWVLSVDAGSLLSVVKFDPKKAPSMAKKHGAADPEQDYLLVRARIKASLGYVADVLEAIYKGEVEGWQRPIVDEDKTADYKYRTIVTPEEWKKFLCYEVDGIDYSSHVKEETVRRQPEPKVKNLYSALSGTWSAWAKLQDTPPYGGYTSWKPKPDCKNCNHTEVKHNLKGDKCNFGWNWVKGKQEPGKEACTCTKYEPKPVPAPATKSPAVQTELPVGEDVYPSTIYGSLWDEVEGDLDPDDALITEAWDVDENGVAHTSWCSVWDGDSCICADPKEDEDDVWDGTIRVITPSVPPLEDEPTPPVAGTGWFKDGVWQEGSVKGETKAQRKARNARNRRRRRAAQKSRVTS